MPLVSLIGVTTYSAVSTTGIYCRPGCGAKPLAENVRTFEHAAAAEAAGYRACLRCRPYRVAGTLPAEAPELVCRAVQLIIAGLLDESGEAALAARLGFSARHLRRIFFEHLGVTPDQFARSRRAHFARRMLDDSDLRIADVAFAAGYGSLRQFNREMREIFQAPPRELRKRRRRGDRLVADGGLVLRLPFDPPYDWESTAAFLAAHAMPGVESVEDGAYRRTISIDGQPGLLEIGPGGAGDLLLTAHLPYWEGVIHIAERAARVADPGRPVPGAWGPFEVAVGVVVRDQLAEQDADDVLRKLVEVHGMPVPGLDHGLTHAFPSAEALVGDELVGPLAREVAAGNLLLDGAESADVLERIPGVTARAARQVVARVS